MTAELSLKPVNTHQEVSSQGATLDERGDSWTDSGRTRDAPERRADEKTTPRKRGRPARRCGSPRVVTRGRAGEATYRPIGSASMFTRIGASAEFAGTSVYSEIPPGVPSSQSKHDLTNILLPLQTY